MDGWIDKLIDRQIERYVNKLIEGQEIREKKISSLMKQPSSKEVELIDGQIDRQIDRWIDKQIDRWIDRQVDRQMDR